MYAVMALQQLLEHSMLEALLVMRMLTNTNATAD
jgi:hypothetical protein